MTEHHHQRPRIAPVSMDLRRAIVSGAGVPADELGATLGCGGDVVRVVRDALFRDRVDGQPTASTRPQPRAELSHDAIDHLMRANRGVL